ncbi:hypothetical protein K2X30_09170 [bacterium]|jgi:hypothetical protein|nr:hypothetical protein [bacterium]
MHQGLGLLFLAVGVSFSTASCSGSRQIRDLPFQWSDTPAKVSRQWNKVLPGFITDLDFTGDGNALVVATIPDRDGIIKSAPTNLLSYFNRDGKLIWRIIPKTQIKSQSVSDDGSIVVISTYNERLTALNSAGKVLWSVRTMCRPHVMSKVEKIVCYHDDATSPKIAFEVYDFKGKRYAYFPRGEDILSLKLPDDQLATAIALTHGQVILFDSEFKKVWERRVNGEVLDLAVGSGDNRLVAALFENGRQQRVAMFDHQGNFQSEVALKAPAEQIEFSPDGSYLVTYGNTPRGQSLNTFSVKARGNGTSALEEQWKRGDLYYAEYSSFMTAAKDFLMIGYEDISPKTRWSHILGFSMSGKLNFDLPLEAKEGAYLYTYSYSHKTSSLAVATDDASLTVYEIKTAN